MPMSINGMIRLSLILCAALCLALSAVSCDKPAARTCVPAIDLLSLSPPVRKADASFAVSSPRKKWSFEGGLPDGWIAGPEGVRVQLQDDGILLEPADDRPVWLETRFVVDPLRYARLRATLEPITGRAAELFFSTADPPRFSLGNRAVVRFGKDMGEKTHVFKLPLPDGVEAPIRTVRLYPGSSKGRVVVKRVELMPRRRNFIKDTILKRELIDLRQEYRRCWRLTGSGSREISFKVPDQAPELRFATGTLVGDEPARLELELTANGGSERTIFNTRFESEGEGWANHRVSLERWSGQEITLLFRVIPECEPAISLLGSPMIFAATTADRPNVLLVLVDTLRADRLSLYGHDRRTSPCLDRLSRSSMLFSRATAPSSWTIPSVASLFTGLYPERLGVGWGRSSKLPTHVPTIAERFKGEGYTTAGFVANFVLAISQGFARGFDTYYLAPYKEYSLSAEALTRKAVNWLEDHGDEQFFCYLHYMDPHNPYDSPLMGLKGEGDAESFRLGQGKGWTDGNIWPLTIGADQLESPEELEAVRGMYDEELAYMDFQIGHLMAQLRQRGLLDRLVVLLTADHGEELYDHGFWSHGYTLYQEVVHVPLLFRTPQTVAGGGVIEDAPASLVDVAPTLAAEAGLPTGPVPGSDGSNLTGLADDRVLVSQTMANAPLRFALIDGDYKYVFFDTEAAVDKPPTTHQGRWLMGETGQGLDPEALFDLGRDPAERINLATSLPDVAGILREERAAWYERLETPADRPPNDDGEDEDNLEERLRALGYIQ